MKVNTVNNIKIEGRKENRFLVDKVDKKIKSIQRRLIIIIIIKSICKHTSVADKKRNDK
jgi:hypothetical protein